LITHQEGWVHAQGRDVAGLNDEGSDAQGDEEGDCKQRGVFAVLRVGKEGLDLVNQAAILVILLPLLILALTAVAGGKKLMEGKVGRRKGRSSSVAAAETVEAATAAVA